MIEARWETFCWQQHRQGGDFCLEWWQQLHAGMLFFMNLNPHPKILLYLSKNGIIRTFYFVSLQKD